MQRVNNASQANTWATTNHIDFDGSTFDEGSLQLVYTDATTGTVAAATIQLGVAVAGATVIAATALENSKGIGTSTALTLALTDIAANTPLIARHTGVATTAAGEYFLELEYVTLQ